MTPASQGPRRVAKAATLAGRQDDRPFSRSLRQENKKRGPGQQKRGHGVTKEITVDRQKEGRRLVSVSPAIEEAERPRTAKEVGCRAPRARAR